MAYISDDIWIERFKIKGNYPDGTLFTRNISKGVNCWNVNCSICSTDEYVINKVCDGMFTSLNSNILKGRVSCRCSKIYSWTKEQRSYQIEKICKEEGHVFTSFIGSFNGNKTRMKWCCSKGHSCETGIKEFINAGIRCRECRTLNTGDIRRHEWVGKKRITEDGATQTILRECGRYNLYYLCERCNRDLELNPTLFKITKTSWTKGTYACSCAKVGVYRTKAQYELLCERACEGTGKPFVGFYGEWKDIRTKAARLCCEHGIWATSGIDKLISKDPSSCPECGKGGYKREKGATLYLVNWSDDLTGDSIVKFGITNCKVSRRVNNQKLKTSLSPKVLHTFTHDDGGLIADIESELKQIYKVYLTVHKDLLPDGYTEAFFYNEKVLAEIKDYVENRLNHCSVVQLLE
jgi:hypothetical protein